MKSNNSILTLSRALFVYRYIFRTSYIYICQETTDQDLK